MRITTTHSVRTNHLDPTRGSLTIEVYVNEESVGTVQVCSGPIRDIEAFVEGKLTMTELSARWRMNH